MVSVFDFNCNGGVHAFVGKCTYGLLNIQPQVNQDEIFEYIYIYIIIINFGWLTVNMNTLNEN